MEQRQGGRVAQRRRTRRAIVDAATGLLAAGSSPTVDDVAAAAEVSRRTVYMHFPTLDQLLLDATLGALGTAEPEPDDPPWARGEDAADRVDALAGAILGTASETLPLGRQIVRLTVDPAAASPQPRRGFRRVQWIEEAVAPLRDRLDDEQAERLVSALAMVLGFEGMIVMRDVRGADAGTEDRVIRWAARALVDAMAAEAAAPGQVRPS